MRNRNSTMGGLLILIGCIFLFMRYVLRIEMFNLGAEDFWPVIILGLGLIFEAIFFVTGSKPGFLVPGGILTTLGILFFFEVSTDWNFAEYTWPVYIFSVAIGLFQLYLFSGRPKGLLIAVFILTAIGTLSAVAMIMSGMFSIVDLGFVIPVILIIVGLFILFGRNKSTNNW